MISPDDKKKPALSFDQFNLTKCADSLLPVIIQDSTTLKVLMLGYMNKKDNMVLRLSCWSGWMLQ